MTEPEWKAEFRRQLEKAGEAQVRTEFHTLATGGEELRLCLVQWLREQEQSALGVVAPVQDQRGGWAVRALIADCQPRRVRMTQQSGGDHGMV